jgi:hypothetical protein
MPRSLALFLSIIGHPMLVPTYALLLLLAINPYAFGTGSLLDTKAILLLIYVFTTSALIPGIGIGVMKPLGFVQNLESPEQQERTGPYIVTGIFYLWLYKNISSGGQVPPLYVVCLLGATISLFLAFFCQYFYQNQCARHRYGRFGGDVVADQF